MLPGFFIGVRQAAIKRKPVIPECEDEETRSSLGTINSQQTGGTEDEIRGGNAESKIQFIVKHTLAERRKAGTHPCSVLHYLHFG